MQMLQILKDFASPVPREFWMELKKIKFKAFVEQQ